MGKGHEQTLLKRQACGQEAHEKNSTLLVIKEMPIRTTMKYHLTQSEWPLLKRQKITDGGKVAEKKEHLYTVVGGSVN